MPYQIKALISGAGSCLFEKRQICKCYYPPTITVSPSDLHNHSYLTNNLTKAVRSSFNHTNVLKEGVLAACAVNTEGAPQTQHPWAALHRAEPWADEPLPEDVGGILTSKTEYQGWNQPAIIIISKNNVFFLSTIQTPGRQRQRAWALLWLSWNAWDTNSCSRELISQPCLKPPSALGVFGCPLLHKENSTGLLTQTPVSPRNTRTAMHLEKCLKY